MKKIIRNIGLLATFNSENEEIKNAWLLVENNMIRDFGKEPYSGEVEDLEVINGKELVILPGFVNVHHHFYQSLFRAVPEVQNSNLFDWLVFLYDKWKNIDEEAVYVSTQAAIIEMMKSGVTTTSDHHYLFPKGHPNLFDAQISGAKETGIRFYATRGSMSLSRKDGGLPPDSVVQTEEEILADYDRVVSFYHDPGPFSMIRVALAPCSPFSVTQNLMIETMEFAEKRNLLVHTHLAETTDEERFCLEKFGLRPVDYMEKIGWLKPNVWFVHLVHLSDSDIDKLAIANVGMAHCPTSNMRLGSGIARVTEMKNKNIRIGIGVDGSSSNDTGNFLLEIRNTLLLQRVKYGASALTARDVLKMATLGGTSVLHMEREIGSIEKGKAADLIGFNIWKRIEFAGGLHDPVGSLVFCDAKNVDFSMINGKTLIENGNFTEIDVERIVKKQNEIAKDLIS